MAQAASEAYRRPPTAATKAEARRKFKDPTTCATSLLIAARHLLGPECLEFEPETLWLELDPPPLNRDKLLAALALTKYPAYYWDWRVFGNTALAFSHSAVIPDEVPHPDPAEMAWAIYEAELIFALTDPDGTIPQFDDGIATYSAAVLHHEGFVACPDALSFADDELVRLACRDSECEHLHAQVKDNWRRMDKTNLEERNYADTPLGVQLAHQAEIYLYLVRRANDMASCVSKI